jgi:glucosamine 6-phosphate synthetase-like amidotransferase/phosphosugar isomerase protein
MRQEFLDCMLQVMCCARLLDTLQVHGIHNLRGTFALLIFHLHKINSLISYVSYSFLIIGKHCLLKIERTLVMYI